KSIGYSLENSCTAVIIQTMVLGGSDGLSGSGVMFSRNPLTGDNITGVFAEGEQGDVVVGGSVAENDWHKLQNAPLFDTLKKYAHQLELHYKLPVEVEFTIENGTVWLLQARKAILSDIALVTYLVDLVINKNLSQMQAINSVRPSTIERLLLPTFS